jgi:hypothetical protein
LFLRPSTLQLDLASARLHLEHVVQPPRPWQMPCWSDAMSQRHVFSSQSYSSSGPPQQPEQAERRHDPRALVTGHVSGPLGRRGGVADRTSTGRTTRTTDRTSRPSGSSYHQPFSGECSWWRYAAISPGMFAICQCPLRIISGETLTS